MYYVKGVFMDVLIEMCKPYLILFCVLIVLCVAINTIIKVISVYELLSEKKAYDLIAEDEAMEIELKKRREHREQELHREQMKLVAMQQRNAEDERYKFGQTSSERQTAYSQRPTTVSEGQSAYNSRPTNERQTGYGSRPTVGGQTGYTSKPNSSMDYNRIRRS